MKTNRKTLALNRETIRELSHAELNNAGGGIQSAANCKDSKAQTDCITVTGTLCDCAI